MLKFLIFKSAAEVNIYLEILSPSSCKFRDSPSSAGASPCGRPPWPGPPWPSPGPRHPWCPQTVLWRAGSWRPNTPRSSGTGCSGCPARCSPPHLHERPPNTEKKGAKRGGGGWWIVGTTAEKWKLWLGTKRGQEERGGRQRKKMKGIISVLSQTQKKNELESKGWWEDIWIWQNTFLGQKESLNHNVYDQKPVFVVYHSLLSWNSSASLSLRHTANLGSCERPLSDWAHGGKDSGSVIQSWPHVLQQSGWKKHDKQRVLHLQRKRGGCFKKQKNLSLAIIHSFSTSSLSLRSPPHPPTLVLSPWQPPSS